MRYFTLRFIGLATLIVAPTVASAADMSRPPVVRAAPAYVPAPPNWTGLYIGVNLGVGNERFSGTNGSASTNDFTYGGQIGYNYQSGNLLYGLEADLQATTGRVAGMSATCGGAACSAGAKINGFGTLRGRVGAVIGDNFLIYGTGGLAFIDVGSNFGVAGFPRADTYSWRMGYALGAGVEQMLWGRWSWKAEYLYLSAKGPDVSSGAFTQAVDVRDHLFRVGLNYHF